MKADLLTKLNAQLGPYMRDHSLWSGKPSGWVAYFIHGALCRLPPPPDTNSDMLEAYHDGLRWFLEEFEP